MHPDGIGEGKKKNLSPHTHRLTFCYSKEGLKEKKGALFIYFILSSAGTTKKKSKSGESTFLATGKYHCVKSRRKKIPQTATLSTSTPEQQCTLQPCSS